jgi:hypothetical protein
MLRKIKKILKKILKIKKKKKQKKERKKTLETIQERELTEEKVEEDLIEIKFVEEILDELSFSSLTPELSSSITFSDSEELSPIEEESQEFSYSFEKVLSDLESEYGIICSELSLSKSLTPLPAPYKNLYITNSF